MLPAALLKRKLASAPSTSSCCGTWPMSAKLACR